MAFIKLNFVNSYPDVDEVTELESYFNTDKLQAFCATAQLGPDCDAPKSTNSRISFLDDTRLVFIYCKQTPDEILNLIALANQKEHY